MDPASVPTEGTDVDFRVKITNSGTVDSTVSPVTFSGNFSPSYVEELTSPDITVVGGTPQVGFACQVFGGSSFSCDLPTALAPGDFTTVQIRVPVMENSYENNDLSYSFSAYDDDVTASNSLEGDVDIRDLENPVCTETYIDVTTTRAELQAAGSLDKVLGCTDPDGGNLSVAVASGTEPGQAGAAHSGTLMATPSASPSAHYTPSGATLANPAGVTDYFELVVTDDEGDTDVVYLGISALTQSNIALTVSGVGPVSVPAGGATVTYTATITNAGPDAIGQYGVGWGVSSKATIVSSTAGGVASTCRPAEFGNEGFQYVGCGTAALPAIGGTSTSTLTVRYEPGVKGLVLPASVPVNVTAYPTYESGASDPASENNFKDLTSALTAAPVVVVTPPVKPNTPTTGNDKLTGTKGNDKIDGGAGNDTINGGIGNDFLKGGLGADKLLGGTGNDTLDGGVGNDTLDGGAGNDKIVAGSGNDKVAGGAGNDKIDGGSGNDTINGGAGKDTLSGGTGNDKISAKDNTRDVIKCGGGKDVVTADKGDKVAKDCEKVIRR